MSVCDREWVCEYVGVRGCEGVYECVCDREGGMFDGIERWALIRSIFKPSSPSTSSMHNLKVCKKRSQKEKVVKFYIKFFSCLEVALSILFLLLSCLTANLEYSRFVEYSFYCLKCIKMSFLKQLIKLHVSVIKP